jgi:hypothetical protein
VLAAACARAGASSEDEESTCGSAMLTRSIAACETDANGSRGADRIDQSEGEVRAGDAAILVVCAAITAILLYAGLSTRSRKGSSDSRETVASLADTDSIGPTGNYDAVSAAVEVVDECCALLRVAIPAHHLLYTGQPNRITFGGRVIDNAPSLRPRTFRHSE